MLVISWLFILPTGCFFTGPPKIRLYHISEHANLSQTFSSFFCFRVLNTYQIVIITCTNMIIIFEVKSCIVVNEEKN